MSPIKPKNKRGGSNATANRTRMVFAKGPVKGVGSARILAGVRVRKAAARDVIQFIKDGGLSLLTAEQARSQNSIARAIIRRGTSNSTNIDIFLEILHEFKARGKITLPPVAVKKKPKKEKKAKKKK